MTEGAYPPALVATITDYVDVTAPPVGVAAHFIFGTNQVIPVDLVAERYRRGLAPFVIATGGVNRHSGIVEGREFHRLLVERGVDESAIRCEDRSANTWQNVEFALPFLREAVSLGLPVTAVCKWYHRRAIHCLRTLLPEAEALYAITFEPVYSGLPVTRKNWAEHPDGQRRVIREWQEVSRRVADLSFKQLNRVGGAWQ
jgi:uncharacterized SAM-binding protein YcdF (DUF218 family)